MRRLTPIVNIEVQSRQRRTIALEALRTLAASIAEKGLLHPIVLREKEGGGLILVAGQRRLRAVQTLREPYLCDGEQIPPYHIPFLLLTDLTDIQFREAELEENILREDLTWQERITAMAELHELRKEQDPKHSAINTAREIAVRLNPEANLSTLRGSKLYQDVSRSTLIAPFLDDPDVARARDSNEAFAIVERRLRARFSQELAKRERKRSVHTLIRGDLREEMRKLPRERFSCIIADPPYGIGADEFGDAARLRHKYSDEREVAVGVSKNIVVLGDEVALAQAHLYLFCDIGSFLALRDWIETYTSWTPCRTPLVWCKGTAGHAPRGIYTFRRTYELVLFAHKGSPRCNFLQADMINIPSRSDKVTAAQKPTALYDLFLRLSCTPGDAVLDPCCGGGTIFEAAGPRGMKATGIELDEDLVAHCTTVIAGLENKE